MRTHPFVAIALFSAGCSTTVSGAASDAATPPNDTSVAIDSPPAVPDVSPVVDRLPALPDVPLALPDVVPVGGPCTWRAGEMVVLSQALTDRSNRRLLDVESAEGGAWALTSNDAGISRQPDITLERLEATGRRRGGGIVNIGGISPQSASLAIDEALGLRGLLEHSGEMATGPCALSVFDATGVPTRRFLITLPGGGFSLSGCYGLMVNRAGFTFLSEQVRALWGVSMVQVGPTGQTPDQRAPSVLDGFPPVPNERFALGDRSFVLAWRDAAAMSTPNRLRVRHFAEDGSPLGEEQTVRESPLPLRSPVVVGTSDGVMALWEETVDTLPMLFGLALRALDRDGRPRSAPRTLTELGFYQGGVSATFAQGDVLATAIIGSGVLRPVVIPLGTNGAPRGVIVPLPTPAGTVGIGDVRIVTTSAGALVVYTTDPMMFPNRVVAVPLSCVR